MGATGAVGQIFLELLAERDFPMDELRLLASSRSVGKQLVCGERTLKVGELTHDAFDGIDIVLSSAGGAISKQFVPSKAMQADSTFVRIPVFVEGREFFSAS